MLSPSDTSYQETKRIMLGQAGLKPEFRLLADWIDKTYGVRTVNIIYDTIEKGKRPRLEICFEREAEKTAFRHPATYTYDREKQKAISEKFKETMLKQNLSEHYLIEEVWVVFSAFEPVAKSEAVDGVPEEKVAELKSSLHHPDLWEISRFNTAVTFFLYTDQQVRQYERSETKKQWAGKFFDLLKPYDPFGYWHRDTFDIYLDSKENFENNYSGNWYYYYK